MKCFNFLFLCIITSILSGCDPYGMKDDKPTHDNSNEEPEVPTLTLNDLKGVWVDPSDTLYFISISGTSRYTFCFNDKLIGSGYCTLEDGILTLNDQQSNISEPLSVTLSNGILEMTGQMGDFDGNTINVNLKYELNQNEKISKSAVGTHFSCTDKTAVHYVKMIKTITYNSDFTFVYECEGLSKKTDEWKNLNYDTYYYVYREPYTYAINLTDYTGELEIYDFPFVYAECYMLSFHFSNFRVN